MLLGKRSRHQMKKTTSVDGITVDVDDDVQQPSQIIISDPPHNPLHEFPKTNFAGNGPRFFTRLPPRCPSTMATATAAAGRSGSTSTNRHDHVVDSPHFLRSCCLCKRRLAPGRDIYMYKGDTAFCSQECREEQMKQDERKEKLNNVTSSNKEDRHGHASSTSNSKPSTKTKPALAAA